MNVSHCLSSPWLGHDRSVGEWMYLTVSPLHGPGHDSSVGERMYPSVHPLHGPGHNSSVGEWMYLTVSPLHGPGHDRSVGEWMYLTVSPLHGLGFNSRPWQSISKYFSLTDHTLSTNSEPAWRKNCLISRQRYYTTRVHRGKRLTSNYRQIIAEKITIDQIQAVFIADIPPHLTQ